MPYIIIMHSPRVNFPPDFDVTQHAVATLEQAREYVLDIRRGHATTWFDEFGGTIHLQDGTAIEVKHWGATRAVNWMVENNYDPATENFLDTYNKEHS